MKNLVKTITMTALFLFTLASGAVLADINDEVTKLQHRWAEVNYQLQEKAQLSAFEALVSDAEKVVSAYPNSAAGWIWSGIIKSTYAGAKAA